MSWSKLKPYVLRLKTSVFKRDSAYVFKCKLWPMCLKLKTYVLEFGCTLLVLRENKRVNHISQNNVFNLF